jgi:ribosome maturation factor RimP
MSELVPDRASGIDARVRAVAEDVLRGSNLYLVEVSVRGIKGSRVVEIFVDGDEGIDVEELARISREVGFLLETDDVIAGRYSLNVSSPGADRPLTMPRQFPKHVGRSLKVRYRSPEGESRVAEGRLEEVTDDGIAMQIDRSKRITLRFAEVIDARVQLPW